MIPADRWAAVLYKYVEKEVGEITEHRQYQHGVQESSLQGPISAILSTANRRAPVLQSQANSFPPCETR